MNANDAIAHVIFEVRNALAVRVGQPGVDQALAGIDSFECSAPMLAELEPNGPASDCLSAALDAVTAPDLAPLASAIATAAPHIAWLRNSQYTREAIGARYDDAASYVQLIGPGRAYIAADDFAMGFFLIGPRVLYRDHFHAAPELYFNLTGPSGWRLELGEWHDKPSGSTLWNEPGTIHATRVYDVPFLANWTWTKDVMKNIEIAHAPDWDEVEAGLDA